MRADIPFGALRPLGSVKVMIDGRAIDLIDAAG